jgi:hypothetical protein
LTVDPNGPVHARGAPTLDIATHDEQLPVNARRWCQHHVRVQREHVAGDVPRQKQGPALDRDIASDFASRCDFRPLR